MTPILETQKMNLWGGQKLLCENLHLQIGPGEMWGILGANGSGKTTLLQTLAGLLPLLSGKIFLAGESLNSLSRKKIAQTLGILFQDTQDLFPQTVWDICLSGRYPHFRSKEDDAIAKEALAIVELTHQSKQSVQSLSGGERKRLSIATLLTQTPRIYLLDEPTNHLDLRYQVKILNHLCSVVKNKARSILMTLHDVNLAARYCQKILLLLGNGEYLSGPTVSILTRENLSRLYQHPLEQFSTSGSNWWQPAFYT